MPESTGEKALITFDKNGYPACSFHGALLCANPDRTLWRCPECHVGIDFKNQENIDVWILMSGRVRWAKNPSGHSLQVGDKVVGIFNDMLTDMGIEEGKSYVVRNAGWGEYHDEKFMIEGIDDKFFCPPWFKKV